VIATVASFAQTPQLAASHSWLEREENWYTRETFPTRPATCLPNRDHEVARRNPTARSGQRPSHLATLRKEDHRVERGSGASGGAFRQQVGGSDTTYAVVGIGDYFANGTDDILSTCRIRNARRRKAPKNGRHSQLIRMPERAMPSNAHCRRIDSAPGLRSTSRRRSGTGIAAGDVIQEDLRSHPGDTTIVAARAWTGSRRSSAGSLRCRSSG
jgi:hypothetical protein